MFSVIRFNFKCQFAILSLVSIILLTVKHPANQVYSQDHTLAEEVILGKGEILDFVWEEESQTLAVLAEKNMWLYTSDFQVKKNLPISQPPYILVDVIGTP